MLAVRHPRRPLTGFALLAVCIYATALALAASPLLAEAPRLLSGAITFDLLVTAPLLYWFLVVRRTRVPALTVVPLIALGAAAAYLILPERHHGWLALAAMAAVPLAETAVLAVAVLRAGKVIRRMRAAPRAVDPVDALREALREMLGSRVLAHAIASEVALVWYALLSWRARPRVAEGELAFTNDRKTGAAGLLFGFAVASAMEIPVVHVLIAGESETLAWVLTIASGYTLLWILGFARALRLHPVTLGTDAMRLRVGLIWDVTIPYAAIATVEKAPLGAIDRAEPGYLHAAFAGTPQLVLNLSTPVDALGLYGWPKRGVRRVGLYVDDPTAFREALRSRAPHALPSPGTNASDDVTAADASPLAAARRKWKERGTKG